MYTGLVKQLDRNAVPCPLSFGPNRIAAHEEDDSYRDPMELFREETTIAETSLITLDSFTIESWYFKCRVCNLILPAQRGGRR